MALNRPWWSARNYCLCKRIACGGSWWGDWALAERTAFFEHGVWLAILRAAALDYAIF